MKTAEKIMRKKTAIKDEMDKSLPKAQSDALWQQSMARLDEYLQQYSDLPKGVHLHTDNKILPMAAVYLTVKEAVDPATAYRVVENAAIRKCAGIGKTLRRLMKLPGMRSLFVKIWDPLTKKVFGAKSGFQNTYYPKRKGEYRMDVTACPYSRYLTELDCPELTRIFCENDERICGNLPGIRFERTGTIGKGAKRCDFCIRKEVLKRRIDNQSCSRKTESIDG